MADYGIKKVHDSIQARTRSLVVDTPAVPQILHHRGGATKNALYDEKQRQHNFHYLDLEMPYREYAKQTTKQ